MIIISGFHSRDMEEAAHSGLGYLFQSRDGVGSQSLAPSLCGLLRGLVPSSCVSAKPSLLSRCGCVSSVLSFSENGTSCSLNTFSTFSCIVSFGRRCQGQ